MICTTISCLSSYTKNLKKKKNLFTPVYISVLGDSSCNVDGFFFLKFVYFFSVMYDDNLSENNRICQQSTLQAVALGTCYAEKCYTRVSLISQKTACNCFSAILLWRQL